MVFGSPQFEQLQGFSATVLIAQHARPDRSKTNSRGRSQGQVEVGKQKAPLPRGHIGAGGAARRPTFPIREVSAEWQAGGKPAVGHGR